MSNNLTGQSSPYLLQHAENPVHWYPWCEEAFHEARALDRPVFLSIGYSACHWCHVMAHESFEDERIAELLNRYFISIKVDREEHPEIDRIYMEAVQRMTGQGGWPLSVFLTPSKKPFFGGTYWPSSARAGMPGFDQVLRAVAEAWLERRDVVLNQADELTELLRDDDEVDESGEPDRAALDVAETALSRYYDPECGGFGDAPKFPSPLQLRFLLRRRRRGDRNALPTAVATTLNRMAAGGMYDQLGGGFHRYSTDRHWLTPHFEKMLYDNALLATCYLEAWQAGGDPAYRRVVCETLDYVLREMTHESGGFCSSQDADSGGVEGSFYLWTPDEVYRELDPASALAFCEFYDVTDEGNFEGRNILHRAMTLDQAAASAGRDRRLVEADLVESRRVLLEARGRREWPGRDDKILVSWNGLMIDAMARAGAALECPQYLNAAARAADFLLDEVRDGSGRLGHCWRDGPSPVAACLDDYASLAGSLVTLYETRFERRRLDEAVWLVDQILERFTDRERGGFFQTGTDHEPMIARSRDMHDSAIPSGGGLATMTLLRLAKLLRREDYWQVARSSLRSEVDIFDRYPMAAGQLLLAADFYLGPVHEIAVVGGHDWDVDRKVLAELQRRFIPNKVVAYAGEASAGAAKLPALLDQKQPIEPGPTVYVCRESTCRPPVVGAEDAVNAWDELAALP